MSVAYFGSCPECESMNIRISEVINEGPDEERLICFCYECGADWEDIPE